MNRDALSIGETVLKHVIDMPKIHDILTNYVLYYHDEGATQAAVFDYLSERFKSSLLTMIAAFIKEEGEDDHQFDQLWFYPEIQSNADNTFQDLADEHLGIKPVGQGISIYYALTKNQGILLQYCSKQDVARYNKHAKEFAEWFAHIFLQETEFDG